MAKVYLLKSELYRMGGAEKISWHLGKVLALKQYDVTLLTTGPLPTATPFHVLSHSFRHRLSPLKVLEYDRFCRKSTTDRNAIVFGLDRNSYQTHLRASNGVHAAYLEHRTQAERFWKKLSFKSNPLHRLHLQLEKKAFEHPALQKLFTNSELVKREVLKYYRVDPSRIEVVYNGVEWNEYTSAFLSWQDKKREIAARHQMDANTFHFLFVGHNFKRKGLDFILQALKQLKGCHLSVIGKDKNLADYEKLVKKWSLESRVRFLGPRTDIDSFYQLADSLIIPSIYDPFANVTLEALAMGLFVVSSKTNGGSEILLKHQGTVIEDLFNPDAVKEALRIAMAHPKTVESSQAIRSSVKRFGFEHQLEPFIRSCSI